jgi:predicted AAA+ superfamily ATPase
LYLDTINTLSRSFSLQTFKTYLNVLKSKYLIDEIPAWKPNIRSKTRIRSTSKKIFVDQSLGCAAAKMTIDKFINDLRLFGFVFENLVFHDLKVYSEIDN